MSSQLILTFVLVSLLLWCADGQLEELQSNEMQLLNVAVKSRLLEKITEETDKIQFERNELVNRNRKCLLNVSSTGNACKECVVNKCENRGRECLLSESELVKIRNEYNNKSIPGVDFLNPPSVVQEEIRVIKQTSENDIIGNVTDEMKPKGKVILEKVKEQMANFHSNLGKAVSQLPEILPQIEQNIAEIGSKVDMNAVQNMANQAADQIAQAINDPTFNGIRVTVVNGNQIMKDNLPSVMNAMENTLSRLQSAVGQFVGVVRVQAGTAWKQAASNQSQITTDGVKSRVIILQNPNLIQTKIPNGGSVSIPKNNNNIPQMLPTNMKFPQQPPMSNAIPTNVLPTRQEIQSQNLQPVPFNGRRKRRADVPCDSIKSKLYEACHSYHFYCTPCMNEKTILEHDCGREALVAMVAIKQLDIQAGNDVVKYKQLFNKGPVIKKVQYDKKSLNSSSGVYSRAYITVLIGDKEKVFGTSVLPDIQNLKLAGFKLADELWGILRNGVESQSVQIIQTPEFHTVRADFLTSDPKSSAVITGALWGTVGLIMYIGFVAISVMV